MIARRHDMDLPFQVKSEGKEVNKVRNKVQIPWHKYYR